MRTPFCWRSSWGFRKVNTLLRVTARAGLSPALQGPGAVTEALLRSCHLCVLSSPASYPKLGCLCTEVQKPSYKWQLLGFSLWSFFNARPQVVKTRILHLCTPQTLPSIPYLFLNCRFFPMASCVLKGETIFQSFDTETMFNIHEPVSSRGVRLTQWTGALAGEWQWCVVHAWCNRHTSHGKPDGERV